MKNLAGPKVASRLKATVYIGQMLEFVIPIETDEDKLTFAIEDNPTDAKVTQDRVFHWLAVDTTFNSSLMKWPFKKKEIFSLSVSDRCHPPVKFQLHVEILDCPCLNGGSCHNNSSNYALNEIDVKPSYYACQCKTGFTGKNCNVQINKCDPNPCVNGDCVNNLIDSSSSYSCQCFHGYTGYYCNETVQLTTTPQVFQIKDWITKDDDCSIPCQNGGVCLKRNRCRCPTGFTGNFRLTFNLKCNH